MEGRGRAASNRGGGTPGAAPAGGPAAPSGFAAAAIVLCGLLAFANGIAGQFQFDDFTSIVSNPNIRHLAPIGKVIEAQRDQTIAGRPIVAISIALNYAVSGLRVWSYHAVNILIHLLAGLCLHALLRRTLRAPPLNGRVRSNADALALSIALIWVIHPLQTESVTYIVERAEAMAGLLYLLTMLAAVRGIETESRPRRRLWFAAAIAGSAVGMATKEILATVPVMLLLYDRIFLARSYREIFKQRRGLYAGLAGTWAILAAIMAKAPRGGTTGFDLPDLTPLQYVRTQPGVILHYIRMAFWPNPLVLDYGWTIARNAGAIAASSLVLLALLAATVRGLIRRSPLGFAGAWFFGILAPTSSFVPVQTLCFEHRMYLPLASIAAASVVGGFLLGSRVLERRIIDPARRRRTGRALALGVLIPVLLLLGGRTILRNRDYADEVAFCRKDTLSRPGNSHAHRNLGLALVHHARYEEAIPSFERAIELQPLNATAHCNLAGALAATGRTEEAERHYAEAIRQKPRYPEALCNLGLIELRRGDLKEAERDLGEALRLNPDFAEASAGLGNVYLAQKRTSDAARLLRRAIHLRPDLGDASSSLARAYLLDGEPGQALPWAEQGARVSPSSGYAHKVLGDVYLRQTKSALAMDEYAAALRFDPRDTDARWLLGRLLGEAGRDAEAAEQFRALLRLQPGHVGALNALAWVLATSTSQSIRNGAEAIDLATKACVATEYRDPLLLDTLAAAYAEAGRFPDAVATMERAISISLAGDHSTDLEAGFRVRLERYRRREPFRN